MNRDSRASVVPHPVTTADVRRVWGRLCSLAHGEGAVVRCADPRDRMELCRRLYGFAATQRRATGSDYPRVLVMSSVGDLVIAVDRAPGEPAS